MIISFFRELGNDLLTVGDTIIGYQVAKYGAHYQECVGCLQWFDLWIL